MAEHDRYYELLEQLQKADLIGPDGKLRKIIGKLPVTADGVVFCDYEPVYRYVQGVGVEAGNVSHAIDGGFCGVFVVHGEDESMALSGCYSSEDAARRAAETKR